MQSPNSIFSNTRPIWFDSVTIPKFHQQTGEVNVDVCIVGGGISGLTAAKQLKLAGKTVAVIELGRIGSGETGHTTAHLTEVFDTDYRTLISNFGLEGAQLAAQAARRAIEKIELNAKNLGIECGFKRVSAYQFTEHESEVYEIESKANAAIEAGVPNELVFESPLPFEIAKGIRFDHQAQFQPLQYLAGLAAGIEGNGSYVFEETRMLDIEEGEPCRVTTDRGVIIANDVIVATNVPSSNRLLLQTKIASYRTYAIAAKTGDRLQGQDLFWDVGNPYHYIRSFDDGVSRYLIIGGEDHKTGKDDHTAVHFQKLEDWAHQRFDIQTITHRWSGQVIEPVDGLPYIGRNSMSDHVFVATGFSGNGMTFGTMAGLLISDLIMGQKNPWEELFSPGRVKPIAAMKNYLRENIDFPAALISDRLTAMTETDTAVLRENEGAIVRVGAKKVAAYRDPQGELHILSPVCPHMGCFVHWNEAETSWDCPCHGSRFTATGQLLNGPAVKDLSSETIEDNAVMIPEPYEKQSEVGPFGSPLLSAFSCPCKVSPT